MGKPFFDNACGCTRYLAIYDNSLQSPLQRVDFSAFDLKLFAELVKWNSLLDPMLKRSYRVNADVYKQVAPFFIDAPESNFAACTYFLESFTPSKQIGRLIRSWEKAVQECEVNCEFSISLEHPFLGLIRESAVFLPNFGNTLGTCVLAEDVDGWVIDACSEKGWQVSILVEEYFADESCEFFKSYLKSLGRFDS